MDCKMQLIALLTVFVSSVSVNAAKKTDVDAILDQITETNAETCDSGAENIVDLAINVARWGKERTPALMNANFWSRRLNLPNFDDAPERVLFTFVQNVVISNPSVFGAVLAFTENRFSRSRLLAPYAYRDGDKVKAFDISEGYDYLGAHWFVLLADLNPDDVARVQVQTNLSTNETITEDIFYVEREKGKWTSPYFDCGGGNIWMMTYSAPIVGPDGQGNQVFNGVATIDIDLGNVDINQCDGKDYEDKIFYVFFKGTHKCPENSQCIFEAGYGLRRGGYRCECEDGTTIIEGALLESATQGQLNQIKCPG